MRRGRNAGPGNGGGGYVLECVEDGINVYYSYDYKQTEQPNQKVDPKLLAAKSANDILGIIRDRLKDRLPKMAEDLTDFMRFNRSELWDAPNEKRLWISAPASHRLVNIHNEAKIREVQECKPDAIQAVIFTNQGQKIYEADQAIIEKLSPIQLSFLYVHEWLRDYTQDPVILARVDRLLHSEPAVGWDQVTADVLRKTLLTKGLTLENTGTTSAERRANTIREVAEQDRLRRETEERSRQMDRLIDSQKALNIVKQKGLQNLRENDLKLIFELLPNPKLNGRQGSTVRRGACYSDSNGLFRPYLNFIVVKAPPFDTKTYVGWFAYRSSYGTYSSDVPYTEMPVSQHLTYSSEAESLLTKYQLQNSNIENLYPIQNSTDGRLMATLAGDIDAEFKSLPNGDIIMRYQRDKYCIFDMIVR